MRQVERNICASGKPINIGELKHERDHRHSVDFRCVRRHHPCDHGPGERLISNALVLKNFSRIMNARPVKRAFHFLGGKVCASLACRPPMTCSCGYPGGSAHLPEVVLAGITDAHSIFFRDGFALRQV